MHLPGTVIFQVRNHQSCKQFWCPFHPFEICITSCRTRCFLLSTSAVLFLLLLIPSRQAWVQYLSDSFLYFFFLRCLPMWSNSIAGGSVFGNLLLNTGGYWNTSKDKASTSRVNVLLRGQEVWQLLQKLDLMVHTNNLSVLVNVNSFLQSGCFSFVWTA